MPHFDFPNAPAINDTYPSPAIPGLPVYRWDGEKWMIAVPAVGSASDGTVHYDLVQALTSAQQAQARSNIYAAPFDALAYNGMQINGGMEVSQENGATAVTVAG